MQSSKKRKVLLLGLLSSLTIAGSALAVVFTAGHSRLSIKAGDKASGSVLFSRESGEFTRISDELSSTSGKTANGATYYAVAHSIEDIQDTNYIAKFGSGVGADDQYITFSISATSQTDYQFQRITGIKIKTSSGSGQTMYAQYSSDGLAFNNSYSVTASSNPERFDFSEPQRYVRVKGYSVMSRNVVSVELFYECSTSPSETVAAIKTVAGAKTSYSVGDTFEPADVKATYFDGHVVDVNTELVTYSGYNMYEPGNQTVTVTYEGAQTSYSIRVEGAVASYSVTYIFSDEDGSYSQAEVLDWGLLDGSSILPNSANEGATCTFSFSLNYGVTLQSVNGGTDTSVSVSPTGNPGEYSFVMPSHNVQIFINYTW